MTILTLKAIKKWAAIQNYVVGIGRHRREYIFYHKDNHAVTGVCYNLIELFQDIQSDMICNGIRPLPLI